MALNSRELDDAKADVEKLRRDLEAKDDEVRQLRRQVEDLTFGNFTYPRCTTIPTDNTIKG